MKQPTNPKEVEHGCSDWDDVYPLERLRKKKTDLTQKEFAKTIKVPLTTYKDWTYKGKEIPLRSWQIDIICKTLGITFDEYRDLFKDYED
ncbi:hypothetical protein BI308_11740 [Roseofilum reptotaenium AO1-A]|uniref:HTH cro/C1-type domain-containing protein n=1 Tax=Roseofilum reptotaenium AO1-A TaxID=1925591 RepID=A0A1L9QRJ6_9CYAN|nr:hypothetical protein BI308_11740 [Roseofilum reptotaenium AO1-A]